MSGVDIAGLVERLLSDIAKMADGERQFWAEKLTPLLAALEAKDRALLAQAAELAAKDGWVMHWQTKCQATRALEIEATRQRDEALAALKASEEREAGLRANLDEIAKHSHAIANIIPRGALRPSDPGTEQREAGV